VIYHNGFLRRIVTTRHSLTWRTRDDVIAYDAASDSCFPLITTTRACPTARSCVADSPVRKPCR
jgi:hypothetical protein